MYKKGGCKPSNFYVHLIIGINHIGYKPFTKADC